MNSKHKLGVYIHIPFCVRKCTYCDFLSFPASRDAQQAYFHALRDEIAGFERAKDYEVVSVYFGGGTPSLPSFWEIAKTLDAVFHIFSVSQAAEITIECNPGTMEEGKLRDYKRAGINRLSIGLQSADNALLETLGRIHTWETFRDEYLKARGAGFDNISVDLMYGLPGQTVSCWEDTLEKVMALKPEHLSAYSLIIEEGTPFWERYHEDDRIKKLGEKPLFLPSEEEEDRMLELLKQTVRKNDMYRYEISNYARPGRESRHNTGYWLRREYAGFGLGASGQIGKLRYRNSSLMEEYQQGGNRREEEITLTRQDEISETMILGLRLTEGVDLGRFEETFSMRAEDLFSEEIEEYRRAGLLEICDQHLRLTDRGFDVSNLVMSSFV